MKCKEERELIVMPIFYDVDPSDVRKQKGVFGKAFAQQEVENNNKAQLWRKALNDASNIAGWEPKHIANGHESKVIDEIVGKIMVRLSPLNSKSDEDLVGMTTRIEYLKSQLEIESDGVRMVGIWGVGGGGKTTLAFSLFMEISCYFEGHHIIENIREESSMHGLKKLQKNLLSGFSKTEVNVNSTLEGKSKIKSMLCRRKVLVLLDDVDELSQLEALVGSHNWFGSGSRIIITTRDEHLLRTHKVDQVCRVRLLSNDEAMQLFNRHAYNEKDPIEDYETLSLHVVSYAAGLPLAIKVLGSFLYDKEKSGWLSTLDRLKDIPETEIVEKLKISYNGLKIVEKELFLDIACFFRRWKKDEAMEILEACDFHPTIGIEVLRQKALISIVDGCFDMHDLVQEMGHYIVRGENPNNPDKHSRIWKHEENNNMCLGDPTIDNDKTEAIKYHDHEDSHDYDHALQLCKFFSNIKKLRYLTVSMRDPKHVELPIFLSNDLRSIDWKGYPTTSPLPNSFQPMRLAVLKLANSFQKEVWKGRKALPHLKVLELSEMDNLLKTPNFDGLPCLQKLTLSYCSELKKIHPSLGSHTSIQYVKVFCCSKLRMFPTIVHMENLKSLEIENCDKILEFPKIRANMERLVRLSMEFTEVEVLPGSIAERCTNLISLNLSYLRNLKSIEFNFDALNHLKELRLQGLIGHVKIRRHLYHQFLQRLNLNAFKDVEIHSSIVELSNLQELILTWNDFSRLDFNLSQLTRLKLLNVSGCNNLFELPELPSSLTILIANHCKSITAIGDCHKNCRFLCQVSLGGGSVIIDGDRLLESLLEECMAIGNLYMLLQLSGVEIAKGFTPQLFRGNRCTLQLPENWRYDFCGIILCAVMPYTYMDIPVMISMNKEMNGIVSQDDVFWEEGDPSNSVYKSTWMAYLSFGSLTQNEWWEQTYKALMFETANRCSGFGVRLVEKKSRGLKETPANYSFGYTPTLRIEYDSTSTLRISLSMLSNFEHAI